MQFVKAFLLLCALVSANATTPITINIIGKGTVRGATNGQALTIDKAYTLTAAPGSGFIFRGWTGSATSAKASLSFHMQPEFSLTATFEDITRPTVAIFAPKANQRLLTSDILIGGSAKDNDRVQMVQFRVNGSSWTNASGTTFWDAPITLIPGPNKLEAISIDYASKTSTVSAVTVTYVVCEPVQFSVDGPGKISPVPASCYEIGKTYTVTAVPKAGCVFEGWSGSTNSLTRSLKFQMRSRLAFTAKFRDATKPTITVTSPNKSSAETPNGEITIAGRATDNVSVERIFWSANGGQWIEANGTTLWNMTVPLEPGPNRIRVYSQDTVGNISSTREIFIMSVRELARVYFPMQAGNQWTFLGPYGRTSKQIIAREDGSFILKDGGTDFVETYYKYNGDYSQALNLGLAYQTFTMTMYPPFPEFDQKNLAHGGTSTVQMSALFYDPTFPDPETSVQMKYSIKVTTIPKVIVPAGEFRDCRMLSISAWGYIPGKGWDNFAKGAYVLAPNVGIIQNGLFRTVNGAYQFGAWENLEHATVDGIPIGLSPAVELAAQSVQSSSVPGSLTMNPDAAVVITEPAPEIVHPVTVHGALEDRIPVIVPQAVTIQTIENQEPGFSFQFNTELGRTYRVQASYDLVNWADLISAFIAQEDRYDFVDPETSDAFRFYRVIAE